MLTPQSRTANGGGSRRRSGTGEASCDFNQTAETGVGCGCCVRGESVVAGGLTDTDHRDVCVCVREGENVCVSG